MTAKYHPLKNGSWGIRVVGATVRRGDEVLVTKRSGETKTETVDRVLFEGQDRETGEAMAICAIGRRPVRGRSGGYQGRSYRRSAQERVDQAIRDGERALARAMGAESSLIDWLHED